MRWATAALAGAVIGMWGVASLISGAAAGILLHDLTGLLGMSISFGAAVSGAGIGLLVEWCTR